METSQQSLPASKFQRSKSKSPKTKSTLSAATSTRFALSTATSTKSTLATAASAKSTLSTATSATRPTSKKTSKSRSRSGSRGKVVVPQAKPPTETLGKKKISSILRDELNRLTKVAAIEGDENNNYLEDIEAFETETIKLEVCPHYRILAMNGKPLTGSSAFVGTIPEHNDTLIMSASIPSRTFVRSADTKIKSSGLTSSFYRCAISNDEESDKSRLSLSSKGRTDDKGGFQSMSTLTTVSLLDVSPETGEGGSMGMEYLTEMMKQIVPDIPEGLETQIVSGAYQLGSQVLNAGWQVATSLMPDESDMEPQVDVVKINGYEIKIIGRGILIQAIYINSDRHGAFPPVLDRRSLDPYARLRLWVQLRRDSRPHPGLHGYSDDLEMESKVTITDSKWKLSYGDNNSLSISVPTGVCTSHISRTTYPDGGVIIQAP